MEKYNLQRGEPHKELKFSIGLSVLKQAQLNRGLGWFEVVLELDLAERWGKALLNARV